MPAPTTTTCGSAAGLTADGPNEAPSTIGSPIPNTCITCGTRWVTHLAALPDALNRRTADTERRSGAIRTGTDLQPAIDLRPHDPALGEGMVVAAAQRRLEVGPRVLEALDLLGQRDQSLAGDRLPLGPAG